MNTCKFLWDFVFLFKIREGNNNIMCLWESVKTIKKKGAGSVRYRVFLWLIDFQLVPHPGLGIKLNFPTGEFPSGKMFIHNSWALRKNTSNTWFTFWVSLKTLCHWIDAKLFKTASSFKLEKSFLKILILELEQKFNLFII